MARGEEGEQQRGGRTAGAEGVDQGHQGQRERGEQRGQHERPGLRPQLVQHGVQGESPTAEVVPGDALVGVRPGPPEPLQEGTAGARLDLGGDTPPVQRGGDDDGRRGEQFGTGPHEQTAGGRGLPVPLRLLLRPETAVGGQSPVRVVDPGGHRRQQHRGGQRPPPRVARPAAVAEQGDEYGHREDQELRAEPQMQVGRRRRREHPAGQDGVPAPPQEHRAQHDGERGEVPEAVLPRIQARVERRVERRGRDQPDDERPGEHPGGGAPPSERPERAAEAQRGGHRTAQGVDALVEGVLRDGGGGERGQCPQDQESQEEPSRAPPAGGRHDDGREQRQHHMARGDPAVGIDRPRRAHADDRRGGEGRQVRAGPLRTGTAAARRGRAPVGAAGVHGGRCGRAPPGPPGRAGPARRTAGDVARHGGLTHFWPPFAFPVRARARSARPPRPVRGRRARATAPAAPTAPGSPRPWRRHAAPGSAVPPRR